MASLAEQGYEVASVVPVVKCRMRFEGSTLTLSSCEVAGALVTLVKGGDKVFVQVDLKQGEVVSVGEAGAVVVHGA